MKLQKISIENYKSIEDIDFKIFDINGSYTYSLLGINESGKSSFLKAIALLNKLKKAYYPIDFFDESKPIIITLHYSINNDDLKELLDFLVDEHMFDLELCKEVNVENVILKAQFPPNLNSEIVVSENIKFTKDIFLDYILDDSQPVKKSLEDKDIESLSLTSFFNDNLKSYFWDISHDIVFWEASPEYLLLDEIDLVGFSKTLRKTSIPLVNCFILSGIKPYQIKKEVDKLTTPANRHSLESRLSENTTKYIKAVWPEHPISVSFEINNNTISLLVEDDEIKYKPKTTNQRSDGFKQFISFLLTISIENYNDGLDNTIILIDEPETHLHPPAQMNLLKELIKRAY